MAYSGKCKKCNLAKFNLIKTAYCTTEIDNYHCENVKELVRSVTAINN